MGKTEESMPISIRMRKDVLEHLRKMARYESYERDEDVSYVDLIHEAILQVYPMPIEANGTEDQEDEA